jgi:predicted ATP-grasp superfamily ATP-dependent carboligase
MEVNPRLWGSLQLTVASGINIPYLLYQLAMSGDIAPHFEYQTDVKFRWFVYGDFMHFLADLASRRKLDFDIFNLFEKNNCHAMWSLSDPLPFWGMSLSLLDYLISDEMRKFRL